MADSADNAMEIRIKSAEGIPESSLVSIRVGSIRRQAHLYADRPYRFPSSVCAQQMKVDVFVPVAHARSQIKGHDATFELQLDPPQDGADLLATGSGTKMALELEVGAGDPGQAVSAEPQTTPNVEQPAAAPSNGGSYARRHHIATEAQPYLDEHNVLDMVQTLLQGIIRDKPADPYGYMIKMLENSSKATSGPKRPPRPQSAHASLGTRPIHPAPPPGEPPVNGTRPQLPGQLVAGAAAAAPGTDQDVPSGVQQSHGAEDEPKAAIGDDQGPKEPTPSCATDALNLAAGASEDRLAPEVSGKHNRCMAHDLKEGDMACSYEKGVKGRVLQRTTTDVLLRETSGQSQWHPIEDLERAAITELQKGDQAQVYAQGERGFVLERTTTDVKIKTSTGKEEWHPVEDLDKIATGGAHALQVGEQAVIAEDDVLGQVLQRTTTDVQLALRTGEKRWFGVEELTGPASGAPMEEDQQPKASKQSVYQPSEEAIDRARDEVRVVLEGALEGRLEFLLRDMLPHGQDPQVPTADAPEEGEFPRLLDMGPQVRCQIEELRVKIREGLTKAYNENQLTSILLDEVTIRPADVEAIRHRLRQKLTDSAISGELEQKLERIVKQEQYANDIQSPMQDVRLYLRQAFSTVSEERLQELLNCWADTCGWQPNDAEGEDNAGSLGEAADGAGQPPTTVVAATEPAHAGPAEQDRLRHHRHRSLSNAALASTSLGEAADGAGQPPAKVVVATEPAHAGPAEQERLRHHLHRSLSNAALAGTFPGLSKESETNAQSESSNPPRGIHEEAVAAEVDKGPAAPDQDRGGPLTIDWCACARSRHEVDPRAAEDEKQQQQCATKAVEPTSVVQSVESLMTETAELRTKTERLEEQIARLVKENENLRNLIATRPGE